MWKKHDVYSDCFTDIKDMTKNMDFLLFFIVLCIVQKASLNCPFFENGHFVFRRGESTMQFNYAQHLFKTLETTN